MGQWTLETLSGMCTSSSPRIHQASAGIAAGTNNRLVIRTLGVILAGTFSVLMTLPVTYTFDLGFMVALGILLDTFVVRTIMVPALVELVGDRIWWPSTATGGRHVLHDTEAPEKVHV